MYRGFIAESESCETQQQDTSWAQIERETWIWTKHQAHSLIQLSKTFAQTFSSGSHELCRLCFSFATCWKGSLIAGLIGMSTLEPLWWLYLFRGGDSNTSQSASQQARSPTTRRPPPNASDRLRPLGRPSVTSKNDSKEVKKSCFEIHEFFRSLSVWSRPVKSKFIKTENTYTVSQPSKR